MSVCPPLVELRAGRVDVHATIGNPVVWRVTTADPVANAHVIILDRFGDVVVDVAMIPMSADMWLAYLTAAQLAGMAGPGTWLMVDGDGEVVVGGRFMLAPLWSFGGGLDGCPPPGVTVEAGTLEDLALGALLDLSAWDVAWLATNGDSVSIPNSGSGGPLSITNSALVHLEGPAVWCTEGGGAITETGASPSLLSGDIVTFRIGKLATNGDASPRRILNCRIGGTPGSGFTIYRPTNGLGLYVYLQSAAGTLSQGRSFTPPNFTTGFYWGRVSYRDTGAQHQIKVDYAPDSDDGAQVWNEGAWTTIGSYAALSAPTLPLDFFGSSVRSLMGAGTHMKWERENGDIVRHLQPSDIAAVEDTAATITPTVGPPLSVTRAATGSVTVVVPRGAVYVNPTPTSTGSRLTIPDNPAFDVPADQDLMSVVTYAPGNRTTTLFATQGVVAGPNRWQMYRSPGADTHVGSIHDGVAYFNTPSVTVGPSLYHKPLVMMLLLDRATDLLRLRVYDGTGLIGTASVNAAAAGGLTPAAQVGFLYVTPGRFRSALYRKGVAVAGGYDDVTLARLAAYLLAL